MVEAMKKAGMDFEYKFYNKEGHGNRKMENRIDEWQRSGALFTAPVAQNSRHEQLMATTHQRNDSAN